MKSKLIPYAMDFASFLIQKIEQRDLIRNIILFGSAAREESSETSDIDLFVDIVKRNTRTEQSIRKCLEDFLASTKHKNYWKLLGIENEIKLTIGNLDEWKELKPSIIANGLVIYGKFKTDVRSGKHRAFFIWENIKPNSKRVLFNKQLLGYRQNGRFYDGLMQKLNGERLGKGCLLVPLESSIAFHKLFKKYNIAVKIKKVIEYS
ncbi:nucleotidyltransferase domain-containing protein [Candidatus Woesearchaeota archaeon]|nr:nucleotidyltransferase domain-containing protein [Candidatus Woesearchaeota archaeon]